MKKISVIVPMYNSEDTIEECLSSLIGQTIFEDMELLLVDDCSDDETVKHVKTFEEMYPDNIAIIMLDDNGGPGRARNIAMEYASGDYVGFVDSDDAVVPEMYEHLYREALRTGADVVDGGIYNKARDEAIVYTSDDLTGIQDSRKRSVLIASGGYICSRIFRRDFLLAENIRFREEYVLEDMDYIMEVFCRMHIIANVKKIVYIYRDSGESLSKTVDVDKYLHSTVSAMEAIYDRLSGLSCYEGVKEAVEYALLQLYSYSINICLKAIKDGVKSRDEVLQLLEDVRELKLRIVKGGYDNRYAKSKIKNTDTEIMKINDNSPVDLLDVALV